MILINYNRLFKKYNSIIAFYSRKLKPNDFDDNIQEISIYILKHIDKFNIEKSTLRYYFYMMVMTAYRKIIYDKTKQQIFESSFSNLIGDNIKHSQPSDIDYDDFVSKIIVSLKDEKKVTVFYAILYNKDEKSYSQIAKMLNMSYEAFIRHMNGIRKEVRVIVQELRGDA